MIYGLYKVIYFLMKRTASIKKETELGLPGHYIVHANDFKKKKTTEKLTMDYKLLAKTSYLNDCKFSSANN